MDCNQPRTRRSRRKRPTNSRKSFSILTLPAERGDRKQVLTRMASSSAPSPRQFDYSTSVTDGYPTKCQVKGRQPYTSVIVSETVSDGISITVRIVSLTLDTYTFVSSCVDQHGARMVSDGERCADRMRGGVDGRNSVGISIFDEGLRSIMRNDHSLAKVSGRDGRDHTQCGGIDDRDCPILLVGRVNLLAVGSNAYSQRAAVQQEWSRSPGSSPYRWRIRYRSRCRECRRGHPRERCKDGGGDPGGDTRYLVGSGINRVHFSTGIIRDICGPSIWREQDVFGLIPGKKDSRDDLISFRINDIDGTVAMQAAFMHDENTSTIRRDSALSGYRAHRDGGNVPARHRVENRDACRMRVGNKRLAPIQCHRNTNRERAHGDLGDYLVGRGVDHSDLIGVSRRTKKGPWD